MGKQTALYQKHLDAGARMIDFAGWDMPINYGSQIEEHNQVRQHAGVFDVSHMTVVDISGTQALDFLRHLLANDVARLGEVGKALYSAMLNDEGGVIDDLIVYRLQQGYRLVVNCATRTKDLQWLERQSTGFEVSINERPELAILAVHGPESIERVCAVIPAEWTDRVRALGNFRGVELPGDWLIARTGYTGEKGLELIFPATEAPGLWDRLLGVGVKPVGLGARDTLRLEAGMNLYGHDMDESISPLAANMAQTIAWEPEDRDFIGRAAIAAHRELADQQQYPILTGLVLESRGVLREGQRVITDTGEGVITSGSFSPTLKHSIALARIPPNSTACQVELRGTLTPVRIVKPNFVRFGRKVFE
ncbi:MAG: glycine cleavage system aminomethyltransferase GcvT [Gammaproteobacteria bacterium]|nr:glycine cleavage system aminomethyltransferase GcvT [Pseudomonadales bacterium]MCP5347566.1 glycine cleavage system aminomethyltransferase GcvT [Pseudomonadales bacterium]